VPLRFKQFAYAKLTVAALFSILLTVPDYFCRVLTRRGGIFYSSYDLWIISVFSGVDTICAKDNTFIFKMILNEKNNHRIIQ